MSSAFVFNNYQLQNLNMDNRLKTENPDNATINTYQEDELEIWSQKFGVSKEKLKTAVKAVGNQVQQVKAYLKGS